MKTHLGLGLELVDVPIPSPGPIEVLVKIWSTGVCGTDVYIDRWDGWTTRTVTTPLVLGHEFCDTIVELDSAVTNLGVGQFISGEGYYACRRCRACLTGKRHLCQRARGIDYHVDGAFYEYFVMSVANIWVHLPEPDPDITAIFGPFGNAVHAMLQFLTLAKDVLVIGADPIGIMVALVTKFQGARNVVITDLSDERFTLAEALGTISTVNAGQKNLKEVYDRFSMKEGFSIGPKMSGSGAIPCSMIGHMTHGGRIALLGTPSQELTVDFSKTIFGMFTTQGVTGRQIFETWYAMNALIRSGPDISGIITHRFPVTEFAEMFAVAGDGCSGKVVMHWKQ